MPQWERSHRYNLLYRGNSLTGVHMPGVGHFVSAYYAESEVQDRIATGTSLHDIQAENQRRFDEHSTS